MSRAGEFEDALAEAARRLAVRLPRRLSVAFRPLAEAYFRTTARGGELAVSVNDAFEEAPPEVLSALAEVVVARASGKVRPRTVGAAFWRHVETEGARGLMERNYLARQRSFVPDPVGRTYHLEELFDEVNQAYFEGSLPRPLLGWSRRPLTYRWGWYSSMVRPHGLIVVNRLLDDPEVPRFVLEGTMHHEMLHMLLGPDVVQGRRVVHSATFREMEARFGRLGELRPEYRRALDRYARRLYGRRR